MLEPYLAPYNPTLTLTLTPSLTFEIRIFVFGNSSTDRIVKPSPNQSTEIQEIFSGRLVDQSVDIR